MNVWSRLACLLLLVLSLAPALPAAAPAQSVDAAAAWLRRYSKFSDRPGEEAELILINVVQRGCNRSVLI